MCATVQVRKFHWFFCPPDHYDWQSRWGARGTPRTTSSTKVRAPAHHPPSVGNSWSTLVHLFWLHFTWLYPSYRHCKHLLLKFPLNFAFRLNIMTLSSAICGRNCWLISIHHIPLKFGQKFSTLYQNVEFKIVVNFIWYSPNVGKIEETKFASYCEN